MIQVMLANGVEGAADGDAKGKEKENDGAAAAVAARPELFKPVPGRSRYGSQSEANPLAALKPGCVCLKYAGCFKNLPSFPTLCA